ncbi:MAG: hypothetical protein RIS56_140 [Verrucomicrobiota bacterium]
MGLPSLKVTRNPWPCRSLGLVVWSRFRVAASRAPSYRQEPSPKQLRGICFWQRKGFGRVLRAAAGSGRSEHRNVDTLTPIARQRERRAGPNVPCERRTGPAEAPPPTSPRRQPRHSATAKQVRAPECMRRSFRTLRLCTIPGVSPRAGMRCPVGALRMPHLSLSVPASARLFPRRPHRKQAPGASPGTLPLQNR